MKLKALINLMNSVIVLLCFLTLPLYASVKITKRDLIVKGFAEAVIDPQVEIAIMRVFGNRTEEIPPELPIEDRENWIAYDEKVKPTFISDNGDRLRPKVVISVENVMRTFLLMKVTIDPLFDFDKPFLGFYYRDIGVRLDIPSNANGLWLVAYYRPGYENLVEKMDEFAERVDLDKSFYSGFINEDNFINIFRKSIVIEEDMMTQYTLHGLMVACLEYHQNEDLDPRYLDLRGVRDVLADDFRNIITAYQMSKSCFKESDLEYRKFFVETLQTDFAKEVASEVFEVPEIME